GYVLLTTERAQGDAPAVVDAAAEVHLVRPGLVDEISAELLPAVGGDGMVVGLGGGRVVDTAKAIGGATGRPAGALRTALRAAERLRDRRRLVRAAPRDVADARARRRGGARPGERRHAAAHDRRARAPATGLRRPRRVAARPRAPACRAGARGRHQQDRRGTGSVEGLCERRRPARRAGPDAAARGRGRAARHL